MKLLAAVIAASASGAGHGDHDSTKPYTTTKPYPSTTTGYYNNGKEDWDKEESHMGSGDYMGSGEYGEGDYYKPDHEMPEMGGCNAAAMKMWKMEMEKWKYQQQEWQREFRMWQMENGDHHDGPYDGPYDDHHDYDYDKNPHGDMDVGGWFDWLDMGMDMSWMDGIWEMMGQEDILCPIFGMIPFDPSWGVGTGADWENGCRNNFRMQRQYEELIMSAGMMDTYTFSEQWCGLMGQDAKMQLDMWGLGMYVEYAMPMCKCVTATVKDLVDGNMGMEMMANVGQCVGEIQGFVGMFMEMDVKINIEADFSPENVQMAIDRFNRELGDKINVMDPNIRVLLQYWDMKGEFAGMGIFTQEATPEMIISALAIVDIYNSAYEEDWSLEHFGMILENAVQWVDYYTISRQIFTQIYTTKNPAATEAEIEMYLIENFDKVYAAPTHIDDFFKKHEFDITELAAKTQAVSKQPIDIVDFEQLMMDVINSEDWEMQPYIALGQAYVSYLLDDKEPQFPGFIWGILSCLSTEEVMMMSTSDDEEEFRAAWKAGIEAKYMDTSSEFFMCMMPFNEMAVDWTSHSMNSTNSMDMMAEMNGMDMNGMNIMP